MKHLKTIRIFESLSTDELEDIKDICIELEDKGFKVHVSKSSSEALKINHDLLIYVARGWGESSYFILITKSNVIHDEITNQRYIKNKFFYSDVEEVIDRLKDYLSHKTSKIVGIDVNVDYDWVDIKKSHINFPLSRQANGDAVRGILIKIK